uniref:Adenylate cyclase type 1 n=1 Tax=Camelus bactrianus TaxID=9837 RepID=A0A9W3EHC2_CAMBA|nr:adenylate cyclase type 1 [Camelus bactrianus]
MHAGPECPAAGHQAVAGLRLGLAGREERDDVERVKLDNKRVLFNLLPAHVTQHFLMSSPRNTVLYCQSCSQVGVMLTSIPKFNDFYIQLDDRQQRGGAVSAPPE